LYNTRVTKPWASAHSWDMALQLQEQKVAGVTVQEMSLETTRELKTKSDD